jgi:hypothetical protein
MLLLRIQEAVHGIKPKKKVIVARNLKDFEDFSTMNLKQATPLTMAMDRLPESTMEVRGQRTVLQPAHL